MKKDIFLIINEFSQKIKTIRKPKDVFLQVVEEVGELGKEIRVKYDPNYYKKGDEDGILGESCDIIIALIDILALEGFSKEEVEKTIIQKCIKWKKNNNRGE